MKHWTYIGTVLIAGNLSLLGVVRAAELTGVRPIPSEQGFGRFRLPFVRFWEKPLPEMVTPVTIRQFAGLKLHAVWLKSPAGFWLADSQWKGPVAITIRDQEFRVCRGAHCETKAAPLSVRPLDIGTYEVIARQGLSRRTRGELTLRIVQNKIWVINRLEIEDYLSGVVEAELGSLKLDPEVLKAQIVTARTYVLSMRKERHHGEGYEFCDSPHCQMFGGVPKEWNAQLEVVMAQVRGEYIAYHGRPIAAFYHHGCGGMTSAVEDVWPVHARPYLRAVREPPNSTCQIAPRSQWRVALSKRSLSTCFRRAGWLKRGDALQSITVVRKDRSGRAEELLIECRRPIKVTVGRFRNVINQNYHHEFLKSALFTVSSVGESVVFEGRGWGHGVGLCQEGAIWMSRHGKTYKQILLHYFPHTQLTKLRQ